jgi:hypothetical protein
VVDELQKADPEQHGGDWWVVGIAPAGASGRSRGWVRRDLREKSRDARAWVREGGDCRVGHGGFAGNRVTGLRVSFAGQPVRKNELSFRFMT